MKRQAGNRRAVAAFVLAFLLILGCLVASVVRTDAYNKVSHHETYAGEALFASPDPTAQGVSVSATARSSTWTKAFDLRDEGITEDNFQAYTYDLTVSNDTADEVSDFSFQLTFDRDVILASAWNGSLEIHQTTQDGEIVDTVADMRVYDPAEHALESTSSEGDWLIPLQAGDYLLYTPSTSANAQEMPIAAHQGTTPGLILYFEIGEDLSGSTLDLTYTFHRVLTGDPLFLASLVGLGLWSTALVAFGIASVQIRRYEQRHERDNEIIRESIETFIGFIDAKDPYTHGHSTRVAHYTRLIAQELGYEGEELDRIYYVALLHDCGKIGVPDDILCKPGRLTDEEFEVIKSHTTRGGEILSSFKSLENVGEGARYHHERYDGRGYPEGLAGEDIPFVARMICVADSFDAMNSSRVYRKNLSREHIISELENNRGTQFDPQVADVMLRLIREGRIAIED